MILRELFRRAGSEIGETEAGFYSGHTHIQQNILVYTQVSPLRRNKCLKCTPILSRFGPDFSSDLLGIYLLFSTRMIEFDIQGLYYLFIYMFLID
jgi:hypothetical protein